MLTVPAFHSNLGAPASLYLDFDGHFESATNQTTLAYDTDGNRASFSEEELLDMTNIWQRVAEDFAPFLLDVTTVEPDVLAEGVPSSAADGVALRVAIGDCEQTGCSGGSGAINAFSNASPNVVYSYITGRNSYMIGETVTHEAGHGFGLQHQSRYSPTGTMTDQYHPGDEYWSPIMGGGLPVISTWHHGPNNQGPTSLQDEMSILAGATNGFGYRPDDHSNTASAATPLTFDGFSWQNQGIIETNHDVDVFQFTAADEGQYYIDVDVSPVGPNLDVVLELQDSTGTPLAIHDPEVRLDASLKTNLTSGSEYFVVVRNTGAYGHVGQYSIAVRPSSIVGPGPQIVNVSPPGNVTNQTLTSMRITFDRPINVQTFETTDVQLGYKLHTVDGNPIAIDSILEVAGSGATEFDLLFAEQAESGPYQLSIGPNIADQFGNLMNENHNAFGGEVNDLFESLIVLRSMGARIVDTDLNPSLVEPGSGGLDAASGLAIGPDSNLYVTSAKTNSILRFNRLTGEYIDTFVSGSLGGLDNPRRIVFSPNGNLLVASRSNEILEYHSATGSYLGAFISQSSGGLDRPYDLDFGPDGNLYVSSVATAEILRYDALTGAFIDAFVSAGSGGLIHPRDLTFGDDGNLYVVSQFSDEVLRYDGATGDFMDVFVAARRGGLNNPYGLSFGPDGHLYVTSANTNEVLRFHGETGEFVDSFIPAGVGQLANPKPILFDQGRVLIGNINSDNVNQFDATTGGFLAGTHRSSIQFAFDDSVDTSSLATEDVSLEGPNGPIRVTQITPIPDSADSQFQIDFASQTESGHYRLTVGPHVLNGDGIPMNQDSDLYYGESLDDQLILEFTLLDDRAFAESTVYGTANEIGLDATFASDNIYEMVTEELYSGNKRSRLEHRWLFDIDGGTLVTFFVEAFHDSASEDFAFEFSTNSGASWTRMLTVSKTRDDDQVQSYTMPNTILGPVQLRVVDTDRSRRENTVDTIFIDDMYIASSGAPLPLVTISATDSSAAESGPDPAIFTITRTGSTENDLVVWYGTSGTATAGIDFSLLSGNVAIPSGSSFASLPVSPFDDFDVEGPETVIVTLTNGTGYTIGSMNLATATIQDDDQPPAGSSHASSEATLQGTKFGNYTDTHSSDDVYESIQEELYSGNKRSRLEHQWTLNVPAGKTATVLVEAFHDSADEDFVFEYSIDGGAVWTSMLVVTSNSDGNLVQSFELPSTSAGAIQVRVRDTDRSRGEKSRDTVFIDQLMIATFEADQTWQLAAAVLDELAALDRVLFEESEKRDNAKSI